MGIATGGILVALLHCADAQRMGLKQGDRVVVSLGAKRARAIINVAQSSSLISSGYIGIYQELEKQLSVRSGKFVDIDILVKPLSIEFIRKKLTGVRLSRIEIFSIVQDIVDNRLTDIEITYFVSACYIHELSEEETVALTEAMVQTGKKLSFPKKVVADKHCIGGVAGNRTTALVVPIVAAAGVIMPKTSSRSITSPAGTADTMEVLCEVSLSLEKMKRVINSVDACLVWGGAMDLAPADDRLIRIEHPLSLDPIGQMLASILAKKISAGATHCLIDIPMGKGAKVDSSVRAKILKKKFEAIGKKLGLTVLVVITDGSEPIGNGIGPALEARDLLWTLLNDSRGSNQLRKKAITMAGALLELVGTASKGKGRLLAKKTLDSGAAHKKFIQIVRAQGAKITDPEKISIGTYSNQILATRSGRITHINNMTISRIATKAGAPFDKGAGLYLHCHVGDTVKKGDCLYTIYSEHPAKGLDAANYAKANVGFNFSR